MFILFQDSKTICILVHFLFVCHVLVSSHTFYILSAFNRVLFRVSLLLLLHLTSHLVTNYTVLP